MEPWAENYFFIGDDGAASCYALDLGTKPLKVLFLDHGNPKDTSVKAESLSAFANQISKDLYPPDGVRPLGKTLTEAQRRRSTIIGLVVGLIVFGITIFLKIRKAMG